MEGNKAPSPPREGIIYATIVYWVLVAGVLIAIAGLALYIPAAGQIEKSSLLNYLWHGYDCKTIWSDLAAGGQPLSLFSLGGLSQGDRLATLGISISCLAAVFGMWGLTIQMARRRQKLYLLFTVIIAVVLTLSAAGLVSLE